MWRSVSSQQKSTLVNVLERGEKIDDLVARSSDLNFEAQAFYKTVGSKVNSSIDTHSFCFFFRPKKPIDAALSSNHSFPQHSLFHCNFSVLVLFCIKFQVRKSKQNIPTSLFSPDVRSFGLWSLLCSCVCVYRCIYSCVCVCVCVFKKQNLIGSSEKIRKGK